MRVTGRLKNRPTLTVFAKMCIRVDLCRSRKIVSSGINVILWHAFSRRRVDLRGGRCSVPQPSVVRWLRTGWHVLHLQTRILRQRRDLHQRQWVAVLFCYLLKSQCPHCHEPWGVRLFVSSRRFNFSIKNKLKIWVFCNMSRYKSIDVECS